MIRPEIPAGFLFIARVLCLIALLSLPLRAYVQPLDSESIREAYFLGQRRDEATRTFLAKYVQSFPVPHVGPHIGRIQILTPYAQLVLGSEEGMFGNSAMDAEREYRSHPVLFLVHVWIYSTPTFTPGPKWDEFWGKLTVRVEQKKPLNALKSSYINYGPRGSRGSELELQFDAAQITSAPITIDVSGPGAHPVEARFDLSKLK